MSINRSGETIIELVTPCRKLLVFDVDLNFLGNFMFYWKVFVTTTKT